MTFRDVVTIDPAHLDLGSQTIGTHLVHFKVVTLRGTATGSQSVPLARSAVTTELSVTRLELTVRATSASAPSALIHVSTVATERSVPAS